MPNLVWDPSQFVYRESDSGDLVRAADVEGALELSMQESFNHAASISAALSAGELEVWEAEDRMREEIEAAYIRQFLIGKGGRNNVSLLDWVVVVGLIGAQYRYFERFMSAVAAGSISDGELARRMNMYVAGSRHSYEQGNARSYGALELPAYPGDGSTDCMTNCCCAWDIKTKYDSLGAVSGWECTWNLGPCQHCQHCPRRAAQWSPLFVPVGGLVNFQRDPRLFR